MVMSNTPTHSTITAARDYDEALVLAIELSDKNWVLAAQVPSLPKTKARQVIAPTTDALMAALDGYRRRAAAVGCTFERVITIYEAG